MAEEMGMTDKQFQGFIRLILGCASHALKLSPDNGELTKLKDIL